jgi:hypothetical protein
MLTCGIVYRSRSSCRSSIAQHARGLCAPVLLFIAEVVDWVQPQFLGVARVAPFRIAPVVHRLLPDHNATLHTSTNNHYVWSVIHHQ